MLGVIDAAVAGAGAKTRLKSRIKKFTPHCVCRYYRSVNGIFPAKWTAPEAMGSSRYSEASDVWSLAVTAVEIFQDGITPFCGMSNPAVMELVQVTAHLQPHFLLLCVRWCLIKIA